MEFLQYVVEKGPLWNAWVAAHWERRLRRQDYRDADVTRTTSFILDRIPSISLAYLGHLLLGLCRILLRKAEMLDDAAEELRLKLLTSGGRGACGNALPSVRRVVFSDVTLSNTVGEDVFMEPASPTSLDDLDALGHLGMGLEIPGLDLLLEPEVPPMQADLDEGRRHTASWGSITLPPDQAMPLPLPGPTEAFGEATQAEQEVMAVMRRIWEMPQLNLGPEGPLEDPDVPPPIQGLLGDSRRLSIGGYSAEVDVLQVVQPGETPAGDEPPLTPSQVVPPRILGFDTPPDLPDLLRPGGLSQMLGFSPPQGLDPLAIDSTLDGIDIGPIPDVPIPEVPADQDGPRRKRPRRQKPWLDEETTIPHHEYHDTSSITLDPICEYGLYVPHRRPGLPYVTVFSNLCPLLCEPFVQAPQLGVQAFQAQVEAARVARAADEAQVAEAAAAAEAAAKAAAEAAAAMAEEMRVDSLPDPEAPPTPGRDEVYHDDHGWHFPDLDLDDRRSPRPDPDEQPQPDTDHESPRRDPSDHGRTSPPPLPDHDHEPPDSPRPSPGSPGMVDQAGFSFFQHCAAGGPEAAARQFVGLLSAHMDGVIHMEQADPYEDIWIRRGPEWPGDISGGGG